MRFGSICSGIEAASVAWEPLGWEPAFFSEIEPFPRAVLKHRFPAVPLHGDFTTIGADDYGPIDLLVGGTPCQDYSIAGLRAGLGGDRGNLTLAFAHLAYAKRPRWLVWENVPGVFSTNEGRDFGAILATFSGRHGSVFQPPADGWGNSGFVEPADANSYGLAWRVLDAQFTRVDGYSRAVPQRRRRVFIVGYIGDVRRAAAVLFDAASLRRDTAPRREAGQGIAGDADGGAFGGGKTSGPVEVSPCLVAAGQKLDFEVETFVAHALRGEGFDASEDGTGRGTPIVPVAIQAGALRENPESGPNGVGCRQDGVAYTLEARAEVQSIAFTAQDHGNDACEGYSPTLRSGGAYGANGDVMPAVAYDLRGREGGAQFEGPHDTANIRAASGGSSRSYVGTPLAVRRLTPRECERLQGFPDDWTQIPWRGKPADQCPDGPRYKALGNSMAVNVMRRIGRRIEFVEAVMAEREQAT